MIGEVFKNWFIRLLSALEEGSIIVMDNTSYHSIQIKNLPRSNWRKADIIQWLKRKNVSFSVDETEAELLSKEEIAGAKKTYELDQLANEMAHQVVRLPPYHSQYNPIELVWAQVKREVAKRNTTFKLADVEKLTHETLDNVTQQD
ncbi:uncharacterized protein LOC126473692 [Schistocerca serialis cubense]|uniref:uncharacterized protein LOC126473692 n=1 Tax=Schistocerca serialis cubense TaxID=2023355 RepID=UPI00214E93B0|nr:uncharacterized protein LOC126473692 [Schistocerca serialis cubense]